MYLQFCWDLAAETYLVALDINHWLLTSDACLDWEVPTMPEMEPLQGERGFILSFFVHDMRAMVHPLSTKGLV